MSVNDPVADMLTRIRNASMVKKESVIIPDSRMKRDILAVMKDKKYIKDFSFEKKGIGYIKVNLVYEDGLSVIRKIERISKPGCRIYTKRNRIPSVLQGMGTVIISTSKGIMTGSAAKKAGLGGEIICKIY